MPYVKNQWANDVAPAINSAHLGPIESGIDLVYAQNHWFVQDEIYGPHGVIYPGSGNQLAVVQRASPGPGQAVDIGYGEYRVNGFRIYTNGQAGLSLDAAPTASGMSRWDVIVATDSGTFSFIKGTEAINPSIPDNDAPTQKVPLALVYRATNDNTITDAEITAFKKRVRDSLVNISPASTLSPDVKVCSAFKVSLSATTINAVTPANVYTGARLRLIFLCDGTARTIPAAGSWTNFLFAETLTTTAVINKYWVGEFQYDGSKWLQVGKLNQWNMP